MSKYSDAFKTKVAIEAIKEKATIETLAKRFGIAPMKVLEWKEELLANAEQAFEKPTEAKLELKKVTSENDRLYKKVGQLMIDCGFFLQEPASMPDRR